MAAPTDVLSRIDEIEGELRGLSAELHELRALVTQAAVEPVAEPTPAQGPSVAPVEPAAPIAPQPVDPAQRLQDAVYAAGVHLSSGDRSAAFAELAAAIDFSRSYPTALRRIEAILDDIARYQPAVRKQARELAETARVAAP